MGITLGSLLGMAQPCSAPCLVQVLHHARLTLCFLPHLHTTQATGQGLQPWWCSRGTQSLNHGVPGRGSPPAGDTPAVLQPCILMAVLQHPVFGAPQRSPVPGAAGTRPELLLQLWHNLSRWHVSPRCVMSFIRANCALWLWLQRDGTLRLSNQSLVLCQGTCTQPACLPVPCGEPQPAVTPAWGYSWGYFLPHPCPAVPGMWPGRASHPRVAASPPQDRRRHAARTCCRAPL